MKKSPVFYIFTWIMVSLFFTHASAQKKGDIDKIETWVSKANVFRHVDPDSALHYVDSALISLAAIDNNTLKKNSLYLKCYQIKSKVKVYQMDFEGAKDAAKLSLNITQLNPLTLSDSYITFGEAYKEEFKYLLNRNVDVPDKAKLITADSLYELAYTQVKKLEQSNDTAKYHEAVILNNLGEVRTFMKKYDEAEQLQLKSRAISESAIQSNPTVLNKAHTRNLGYVFLSLGENFEAQEKWDSARIYLEKSLNIRQRQKDIYRNDWVGINFHLSEFCFSRNEYEKGVFYLDEGIKSSSISTKLALQEINLIEIIKARVESIRKLDAQNNLLAWVLFALTVLLAIAIFSRIQIVQSRKKIQKEMLLTNEQKKYIENLSKISENLVSTLNLDKIVQLVYKEVSEVMDTSIFGIGYYYPEEHVLEYKQAVVNKKTYLAYRRDTKEKAQYPVYCIDKSSNGEDGIIFVNNTDTDYIKYGFASPPIMGTRDLKGGEKDSINPKSLIYVPLIFDSKVLGVITVQSPAVNAYSTSNRDFLVDLSRIVSIAVSNARIYEKAIQANISKEIILSAYKHDSNPYFGWANSALNLIEKSRNFKSIQKDANLLRECFDKLQIIWKNLESWTNAYKIEDLNPKPSTWSIQSFSDDIVLYEKMAKAKGLEFKYNLDTNIKLFADGFMIELLFSNILQNALKFTETGYVELSATQSVKSGKKMACIKIKDTGVGIPKQYVSEVLKSDFDRSLIRRPESGSGNGLLMCREILKKMDGKIQITSDEGIGTEVVFFIPLTN